MNNLLTTTAQINYETISTEVSRVEKFDNERDLVNQYLSDLKVSSDEILEDLLVSLNYQIKQRPVWKTMPDLVITVPVVGTGNQELPCLNRFFAEINKDPLVCNGNVRFVFLTNRPAGSSRDKMNEYIDFLAQISEIEVDVLDLDIPEDIGRLNEEIPEMAESNDQPVIGVIRNILDATAMKLALRTKGDNLPIMLQMDIDFEGFAQGGFGQIIENFKAYPQMQFLQCTSDWDSEDRPTDSDPLLKLGSDLMRMLPLVIKANLNKSDEQIKTETIFGEVIQRGIQVPQAQRMAAVALKKSFRMLRFTADELDFNIRSSARAFGENAVRSTTNTIFKWSNRRALRAWNEYGRPPISQWSAETPFSVNDPVRRNKLNGPKVERSETDVINLSLNRMPIPLEWADEYKRKFEIVISQLVRRPICLEVSKPDEKGRVRYLLNLEN